eukprot:CAMPEP_0116882078 /NCGR_PEP_ID=MMETSP0463-20121206/14229_1 /TAXON_ID=181622 /ORGANISM="Strombidinopsis sp, Strain SopsisLIS2011" /LENGTH=35 /DNA_ID= /DNA_START= /DNA_END= /DNA_ORIENTATION=
MTMASTEKYLTARPSLGFDPEKSPYKATGNKKFIK